VSKIRKKWGWSLENDPIHPILSFHGPEIPRNLNPSPLGLQVQNSQACAAIGSVDRWLDLVGGFTPNKYHLVMENIANWKPWPI